MKRNKWTSQTDITPSLLKFREKRKWQIALRRYVINQAPSIEYAPYFGLDIKNLRLWFEYQFSQDIGWEDFGKKWQFDHLIPVTYFDFSRDEDLRMAWNFTNLRVEKFQMNKDRGNRLDVLAAKKFFKELAVTTGYAMCEKLHRKIELLEFSEFVSSEPQQVFIRDHMDYLRQIAEYTSFEFELLNSGRTIEEVQKEIDFLKNLGGKPG